ncbi:MAG: glutamate 5-kinase [Candidatus Gracilibacteria bacterium]|nr:glutamate 5-kinase [Candidatus Gracilibacteria bacterium]
MLCIQTIVIKIGSAVLTKKNKSLNIKVLKHLAEQIAELHQEGHRVLLVSSGAVAAGKGIIDALSKEKRRAIRRHMYSGLGQSKVTQAYQEVFDAHKIPVAQVLITRDNFAEKTEFENLMSTLEGYLKCRVIPILNENDIIANNKKNFGGNDLLAALTAASIRADKLIILSDIDCLYDKDPNLNKNATPIHIVEKITPEIEKMCGGSTSGIGLGGMISKIRAIKIAQESGIKCFMGKGTKKNILHNVVDTKKPVGTYFKPVQKKQARFKHWLKYCSLPKGTITVDEGASKALKKRKSLLFVGVKAISDGVDVKDTVLIVNEHNEPIGTGKINYTSKEIKKALRKKENLKVIIAADQLSL